MNMQRNQIIKLHKVSTPAKSTTIRKYAGKTEQLFQYLINSVEIPRKIGSAIIAALIATSLVFFLLIMGTINNEFNQSTSQFREFSGNIPLSADSHQQAVLSDYLKTMTKVILEENPKQIQEKAAIFRAMAQTTLQELDPGRKRYVIMFLQDANLLQTASRKQASLMVGANLTGANLQSMNLRFTNLQGSNLISADLRGADLRGANLDKAKLTNACYNNLTLFDKKIQPTAVGMREIIKSKQCTFIGRI